MPIGMGQDGRSRLSIEEHLRRIDLFSGMDDESLKLLAVRCRRRRFGAGEMLFHEGDPGTTLYMVLIGTVVIQRATKDGEIVHIAERESGEAFGELALFDDLPRSADAETGSACELLMLERRDLLEYLEAYPKVAWNIIRSLSTRLRQSTEHQTRNESLDVRGRLAAFLVDLAKGVTPDEKGRYLLPRLTNRQIAERIGTRRETVNRHLAHFEKTNLISCEGREVYTLNLAKLRKLGAV